MNKGHDRTLLSAQKYALMRVARAYKTVSVEALQVVGGEIPLDILAKEMHYKYKVRKKDAFRYEDINFEPEMRPSWAKGQLRRITMQLWQKRWDESTKGRITFEYFSNVSQQIKLRYLEVNHYSTQFLTGHGDFKQKLKELNIVEDEECECGSVESCRHILEDCCRYNEKRTDLKNECVKKGKGWPVPPGELMLDATLFRKFSYFVAEALKTKRNREQI